MQPNHRRTWGQSVLRYAAMLCVAAGACLSCNDRSGAGDAGTSNDAAADSGERNDSGQEGDTGLKGVGCFPDCLVSLFAPCYPTGECTSLLGSVQTRCFSDGIKVATAGMDPRLPTSGGVEVFTPELSRCYSMNFTIRSGRKVFSYVSREDVRMAEIIFDEDKATTGTVRCIVVGPGDDYTARIDLTSAACQDSKTGIGGGTPAIPPPTCPESPLCTEPPGAF